MHPSPMARKFKVQPSAGKFTLILFRDLGGPILEHCQEKGGTVNNECHCTLLTNELKPAICTIWTIVVNCNFAAQQYQCTYGSQVIYDHPRF